MTVLLQVSELHKAYGAVTILDAATASFADDQKIGMTGRRSEHFVAKTGQIEAPGAAGHHLNGTAGQSGGQRPEGTRLSYVYVSHVW